MFCPHHIGKLAVHDEKKARPQHTLYKVKFYVTQPIYRGQVPSSERDEVNGHYSVCHRRRLVFQRTCVFVSVRRTLTDFQETLTLFGRGVSGIMQPLSYCAHRVYLSVVAQIRGPVSVFLGA